MLVNGCGIFSSFLFFFSGFHRSFREDGLWREMGAVEIYLQFGNFLFMQGIGKKPLNRTWMQTFTTSDFILINFFSII